MSGTDVDHAKDISTATILVVDDNQQNLELMQAYLDDLGCRIHSATDGVEAIESINQLQPDLVLLDVMMPRMSGFEVCRKIKAQPSTRDISIIMVTALNEVGDFERAVECGTNDFIAKPVNKVELLARVRSLLELRLLKQHADQIAPDVRPRASDISGLTDEGDRILPPPEAPEAPDHPDAAGPPDATATPGAP